MGTPLLERQVQLFAIKEAVAGSYEPMAAGTGGARVIVGAGAEVDIPMEQRNIARSNLSPLGALPGTREIKISTRVEVNTPDTITGTNEFLTLMEGCGQAMGALRSIEIGAISGGSFQRNETVTGGGTARVIQSTANGVTRLMFVPIASNIVAGTLTGGTSGATCTASGSVVDRGKYQYLMSDNLPTISMRLEKDGYQWSGCGMMGTFVGNFENSKPGYFEFTMQGPKYSTGDQDMTTGVTFQTEDPPVLQSAALTVNAVAVVARSITFDAGNKVVERESISSATGFVSAYISGREPKMTISMEWSTAAVLDIESLRAAATKVPIIFQLGTTTGKIIKFFADHAQITGVKMSDKDGIVYADVEFALTGGANDANDEYEIIYY